MRFPCGIVMSCKTPLLWEFCCDASGRDRTDSKNKSDFNDHVFCVVCLLLFFIFVIE